MEQPFPATTAIGIDVGIARCVTKSGGVVAPLNSFKEPPQRLARCQRRMSRKSKF